jgi:hypothetical protein
MLSFAEWSDPRCLGVNKEAHVATSFSFESRAAALAGEVRASARFVDLNSVDGWKFRLFSTVRAATGRESDGKSIA